MKKHLIIILSLTFSIFCVGQSVVITGKIKDCDTNQPLPYATIELFSLHTGTIADKNGKFNFKTVVNDSQIDTIEFSYIGYDTKKICIADFLISEKTIKLKKKPIILEEVVISPKEYSTTIIGIKDKKPSSMQYANIFGANKGNFLENKRKDVGWIKSVSYYLHNNGYPTCPFRVRIYKVGSNNTPEEDILNRNLVVSAQESGWFKIDLSEYCIPFPKEGVFIMMEWINSGEDFYFEKVITVKGKNGQPKAVVGKYYGQSLGTISKKGGIGLWGSNLGNEWLPYDFNYKGKYPNAMINAEIAFEK